MSQPVHDKVRDLFSEMQNLQGDAVDMPANVFDTYEDSEFQRIGPAHFLRERFRQVILSMRGVDGPNSGAPFDATHAFHCSPRQFHR